jgi:hypothetical protein
LYASSEEAQDRLHDTGPAGDVDETNEGLRRLGERDKYIRRRERLPRKKERHFKILRLVKKERVNLIVHVVHNCWVHPLGFGELQCSIFLRAPLQMRANDDNILEGGRDGGVGGEGCG